MFIKYIKYLYIKVFFHNLKKIYIDLSKGPDAIKQKVKHKYKNICKITIIDW